MKISKLSNSDNVVEYCELELKDIDRIYRLEGNYCDILEVGDNVVINFYLSDNSRVKGILVLENIN